MHRFTMVQFYLILSIFALPLMTDASLWLFSQLQVSSLATQGGLAPQVGVCDQIPGLSRRQRRLCLRYPEVMQAVTDGAKMGVSECHNQFAGERWNCTTLDISGAGLGKVVLKLGSREAAFVYAIASAGVVQTIARTCSLGSLTHCSCDNKYTSGGGVDGNGDLFSWGGCSHNVNFASNFARRFIDAKERDSRDARSLMNLHNNRVGRKIVKRKQRLQCKCHGVSGSCTTKTCWRAVPDFQQVGKFLHDRYKKAKQVTIDPKGTVLIPSNNMLLDSPIGHRSRPSSKSKHRIPKSDLVFFEPSPDYCAVDITTGSLGTAGRLCNVTSTGPDSCNLLCCGRGYNTKRKIIVEKCNCKFHWCCEVKCDTCKRVVYEHRCKGQVAPKLYKSSFINSLRLEKDRPLTS